MAWELKEAVNYYKSQGAPGEQSAVVSLLREVQQESGGGIPGWVLPLIAEILGVKESFLQAIVRRIPSLRMADTHCLELCAGTVCGKSAALAALAEKLQREYPGRFTLKYVNCLRAGGKGPNLKWDGVVHHNVQEKLLRSLVENPE